MYRTGLFILFIFSFLIVIAQEASPSLKLLQDQKKDLEGKIETINGKIEIAKLEGIIAKIKSVGLPSDDYVEHSAMMLAYSEVHEQPRWVAHMITPDVLYSFISRTNDFRTDPLISTGTAIKEDYFLEFIEVDSTIVYDGFGYDRGHMAPSADFRWSQIAISESYFYSNISPQRPELNREKWGEMEGHLRGYIYANPKNELYVITMPILKEGLPVIERGVNKISIPNKFVKIIMDLGANEGIAFVMENKTLDYPLVHYAISIDEAEQLTGFNFFNKVEEELQTKIEGSFSEKHWFPEYVVGNVKPMNQMDLPKKHFNTVQSKNFINTNQKVSICGTIVSSRYSKNGNGMLQIDQKYPNEIFTVFIPKEQVINFSYDPVTALEKKCYCFEGKIVDFMGHPTMKVERESAVEEYYTAP